MARQGPSQYVPWCRAVLDDLWHGRPPDRRRLKSTTWYSSTRSVEGGERALASVPEAVVRAMAIFISLWQDRRLVTAPLPR